MNSEVAGDANVESEAVKTECDEASSKVIVIDNDFGRSFIDKSQTCRCKHLAAIANICILTPTKVLKDHAGTQLQTKDPAVQAEEADLLAGHTKQMLRKHFQDQDKTAKDSDKEQHVIKIMARGGSPTRCACRRWTTA